MAFIIGMESLVGGHRGHRLRCVDGKRRGRLWMSSASESAAPQSPDEALRLWKNSRAMKPIQLDNRKKALSILFLCDNCWRAIYAEKQLTRQAEQFGVSDRLLVLSAGFDAKPGSNIPREIVEEAARRKIDLSEEQPCAAFNLREDLDMHDFVFCLDRRIREKMLIRAEQISRDLKLDYAAWERKIRLVKDIAGDKALTQSAWELDISKFNTVNHETVMDEIEKVCAELLSTLRARGL